MIVSPRRIFLGSCILKRLAKGEWPEKLRELRNDLSACNVVLVVTGDHLRDFGDSRGASFENAAMKEARFVDTLAPLWMLHGVGVYHREAFSEYLRLTGRDPLPAPSPAMTLADAVMQNVRHLRFLPSHRETCEALSADRDRTFSGKLRGGFWGDKAGLQPGLLKRLQQKDDIKNNRDWARGEHLTNSQLDHHFRTKWIRYLAESPAESPDEDLGDLAPRGEFNRMPAWATLIAVEKVWQKSHTRPKPSDLVDTCHLALLPYVHVYITEKNLASMIRQAHVEGSTAVYSDFRTAAWLPGCGAGEGLANPGNVPLDS